MNKERKKAYITEMTAQFEKSEAVLVTHYQGLTVKQLDELRSKMREHGIKFQITKNRITKIALENSRCKDIANLFTGPTAIAYSKDVVAAAKVTNEFSKNNENLVIIGGALKEKVLDIDGIKHLASLPSLPELQAKILGLISTPARQIATVVATPATQLITVTKAYQGAK